MEKLSQPELRKLYFEYVKYRDSIQGDCKQISVKDFFNSRGQAFL